MSERITLDVRDEFSRLEHVIMGTAEGFHRDPSKIETVNKTQVATVASHGHPDEAQLTPEFTGFRTAMEREGVVVHQPTLAPESVQDQTCPRDIGFVIGSTFVVAGMRDASRVDEIEGIRHVLDLCGGPVIETPKGVALEGGDVIVHGHRIFVGIGQRSGPEGAAFLASSFPNGYEVIAVPTHAERDGGDVLHLDCTFNPLGLGHALIHPAGILSLPDTIRDGFDWIEVAPSEMRALATNVVSIAPDTLIARNHPDCARVNATLRQAGYRVIEVSFDGVPSIGGSFRCATLPLRRG